MFLYSLASTKLPTARRRMSMPKVQQLWLFPLSGVLGYWYTRKYSLDPQWPGRREISGVFGFAWTALLAALANMSGPMLVKIPSGSTSKMPKVN
jgi:hypothetical protein